MNQEPKRIAILALSGRLRDTVAMNLSIQGESTSFSVVLHMVDALNGEITVYGSP